MTVIPPLAEVVFPIPVPRGFDYRVPLDLDDSLRPGHRVWAPFGSRARQMGMVVRRHPADGGRALKSLEGLVEPDPVLTEDDIGLARWLAERTFCSLGEAAFAVCPLGRRRPPKRPPKDPRRAAESPVPYHPTEDQTRALERILPAIGAGTAKTFLLQGVAASGKTEVYRRAVSQALEGGRGAILLVPEIGLTPQMEDRLRGWFGDALEIWHSEMSDGERWRVWRRVKDGLARVVVGPRSAVFLPVEPLGVLIVDEEHDPSYKQDNAPHYHARDVAEEKVRRQGAVLLLGSATPSLETHARVRSGGMERLALSRRVDDRPFPALQVVDMRKEGWYLSDALVAALRERLARQEQSLLFLNRRGYATRVLCKTCGWEARCPRCEVSLVHHKTPGESLRCHTCDHVQPAAARCPSCGGEVIRLSGRGTQRIAADLATLFPAARILRWDRDAMAARQAHERAYRDVLEGRVDIVVGTQMIAQGHDFPNLTLVGVVDADRSLGFPDFRAAERTFQLLMQVAGRAGRAERPGEVFVQTRLPGHYALRAALIRDYEAFAAEELAFRREAAYPPFTRIAQAVLRSRRGETAQAAAEKLARRLEAAPFPADAAVLGPAPAFHERQDGWSRWQVVIKAPPGAFEPLLARASAFAPPPGAGLSLNVDPEGMA